MFSLVHFPCAPREWVRCAALFTFAFPARNPVHLSLCRVKLQCQLTINAEMKGEARNSINELITLLILLG